MMYQEMGWSAGVVLFNGIRFGHQGLASAHKAAFAIMIRATA